MIIVGAILAIMALLLLVTGGLAFAKKLPGNNYIGIRVAEVRKSKEIWDAAHHVAGTFWLLAGVALVFGALTAFVAAGWLWLIPALTLLVALVAIGVGANAGARTAAALAVAEEAEEQQNEDTTAPAPQVDMDALRRAVHKTEPENPGHNG